MSITSVVVTDFGATAENSTALRLVAPTRDLPNRKHVVLHVGFYNIAQTTNGVSSEVLSVTDTGGCWSWVKAYEYCNANSSVGAGCVSSVWLGKPILQSTGIVNIDVSFAGLVLVAAAQGLTFLASGNGLTWSAPTAAASNATSPATLSINSDVLASREYLFVRTHATNRIDTYTSTAGWGGLMATKGVTGSLNNAVSVGSEYRVHTTNTITSSLTSGGASLNNAAVLVPFWELPLGPHPLWFRSQLF
jgi:hypothetical protein